MAELILFYGVAALISVVAMVVFVLARNADGREAGMFNIFCVLFAIVTVIAFGYVVLLADGLSVYNTNHIFIYSTSFLAAIAWLALGAYKIIHLVDYGMY